MSIASVIQSQLVSTLIEALAPTATPLNRGAGTTRAQVLSSPENGLVSVNIGGIKTELLLAGPLARGAPLLPGMILNLRVDKPATPGSPARATLLALGAPDTSRSSSVFDKLVEAAALRPVNPNERAAAEAPALSPRAVAGPLVGPMVVRQNSLAPLYANLQTIVADASAPLPEPVRVAAQRLLDLRVPVDSAPLTGKVLQQAVSRSGITHEARLATGDGTGARLDVKSALLALRTALMPFAAPGDGAEPMLLSVPTNLRGPEGHEPPEGPPRTAPAPDLPVASRPPAPRRDAVPVGQGIAEPTLAGKTQDTPLVMRSLLADTEAALDRLTLSQYASLPAAAEARPGDPAPAQRWVAEIPLAFAQGTAVLPLEIERDAPRRDLTNLDQAIWRVRFALDGEPVGPLQALVTMQGRNVAVTVWAERELTSRLLHQVAPDLRDALTGDTFERAEIEVFTGRPPQPKLAAGQFLDRRS